MGTLATRTCSAQRPDLGASDAAVVLVYEDPDDQAPGVEGQDRSAEVHVGEGKHTDVQGGFGREDVAEKAGQRRL